MIKIILIFVLTSLIDHSDGLSRERSRELNKLCRSFKTINYHLFDIVASENLEANMREANRWLLEEVSQGSDEKLIEALKLFISMENMIMCTRESVDILEANNYVTDYVASSDNQDNSTRVTDIIRHYLKEHNRKCIPVYSKNLQKKYEQVGESTIQKVRTISAAAQSYLYEYYGKCVRDTIMDLAKDDPDKVFLGKVLDKQVGIKRVNEKKVRELVDKYVVEPCRKFVTVNDDKWYDLYLYDKDWTQIDPSEHLILAFIKPYHVCKDMISIVEGLDSDWLYSKVIAEAKSH